MERIQSVNLDRIEWACAEYGITLEQLAPIAGVPESTINRLVIGDGITVNNLQKIAEFLGHGVLFFVEQGPVDTDSIYTPQFRTILNRKPNLSATLRKFVHRPGGPAGQSGGAGGTVAYPQARYLTATLPLAGKSSGNSRRRW